MIIVIREHETEIVSDDPKHTAQQLLKRIPANQVQIRHTPAIAFVVGSQYTNTVLEALGRVANE